MRLHAVAKALKIVLSTKRGLRLLALHTFASIGLISAVVQLDSAVYSPSHSSQYPLGVILFTGLASIMYGFVRAWPRGKVSRTFTPNNITVNVVVGDILRHKGQIVVGFSDTFDTDTQGDKIISSKSLQGQLLKHRYDGDQALLDSVLASSLRGFIPYRTEGRADKPYGKRARYDIGTVAVIGNAPEERVYCLAYSTMKNDLVAESTVHNLWCAVGQLWDAVYTHGQRLPVAMPLIGTGLSRINALDRESLLRMTLLSFVARSREKLVCNELTVYIHPTDRDKINMLELEAFLKTL